MNKYSHVPGEGRKQGAAKVSGLHNRDDFPPVGYIIAEAAALGVQ